MQLHRTSKDSSKKSHSSQPFFGKENEGSFLSESQETQNTFFSPPTIQTKPKVDQTQTKKEEETDTIAEDITQHTDSSKTIMKKTQYQALPPISHVLAAPLVKQNIQASPGEQLLFTVLFSDADYQMDMTNSNSRWTPFAGKGPYMVSYQVSGGAEFGTPGSGSKKFVDKNLKKLPGQQLPRIISNNIKLFIQKSWNKKTTIKVTATISDLAKPAVAPDTGTAKDADHTITWTIVARKHPCPTKLVRTGGFTGSKWENVSYTKYNYQASSNPPPKTRPYYQNQTILETFGAVKALGFTMNDIEDSWKQANPSINTPDLVARHIFKFVAANATFVINNKDEIYDQHGVSIHISQLAPFKASAFTKGIGFFTPQSYLCEGKVIGTAKIQWLFKGSKTRPSVFHKKIGP